MKLVLLAGLVTASVSPSLCQLNLNSGFATYAAGALQLTLVNASQTAYGLSPAANTAFNFVPADMMAQRAANAQYHLGDITFRVRPVESMAWISGDSAKARKAVTPLKPTDAQTLAAADLTPTLPSGTGLTVTRRWTLKNGTLGLLFDVKNSGSSSIEIGALGAPLEFNNIFTNRDAADTNTKCSVFDPYIGQDAGFVQVTPLLGTLPPLVVVPAVGTRSPLEGWRFLPEDTGPVPYYQSQTFEGLYEWQFHTRAYAEGEWAAAAPWNAPTSATLAPGAARTYGLEFRLAGAIAAIDDTLAAAGRPVAVGVPGYIVSQDAPAKLYLKYGAAVSNVSLSPSSALSAAADATPPAGWKAYTLTPSASAWGRVRLTLAYADGTVQTVHYYITKPGPNALADLGGFLTTKQWFNVTGDPFKRVPGVISYDREANAFVQDEARAWIAGLSDEAGAGSWLAATIKQYAQPNAAEVAKLETFISETLWGSIQNSDGTVKKSVYYYDKSALPNYHYPSNINYGNWWSWDRVDAFATDRGYDYAHVVGAYWAFYRVARNYPGLTKTPWQWYLKQAVLTIQALTNGRTGYTDVGLMDETTLLQVLLDLKREGAAWTAQAADVETRMKARAQPWSTQRYPFGSEMAWDSTGQEGVWAWSNYFGYTGTAANVVNSIIAYQPTVPHWGYNGNARRYWDNIYGGKLQRIERQIHHYGSGLNALPLLGAYKNATAGNSSFSAQTFLYLRAGFGGASGALSNIDQDGFAAASFHSFADTLKWDAYSGDYGPNFVGHVLGQGVYILQHPALGWLAFGGTVRASSATGVSVDVRDSVRRRVQVAGVGACTLDAGVFSAVQVSGRTLTLTILSKPDEVPAAAAAPNGRLVVDGALVPQGALVVDAGAFVVPFSSGHATVVLS